jgi:hypothetical protein
MYFSFKPKKLRFQNENAYSISTPRTAGFIWWKPRVSLRKRPTKGYGRSWAVDQVMDGREKIGGREKRLPPPEQYSGAVVLHGQQRELAGAEETGPTVHQINPRDHQAKAGERAHPSRSFLRQRNDPRGACHDRRPACTSACAKDDPSGHDSTNWRRGEE